MLKNGFLDFLSIFSARQQQHLRIFALYLACSQPLQGDLGDLPVHCDVDGKLVGVDLADERTKDSGFFSIIFILIRISTAVFDASNHTRFLITKDLTLFLFHTQTGILLGALKAFFSVKRSKFGAELVL